MTGIFVYMAAMGKRRASGGRGRAIRGSGERKSKQSADHGGVSRDVMMAGAASNRNTDSSGVKAQASSAQTPTVTSVKRRNSGVLVFIASLVIIFIGFIQLLSAFHAYAVNLAQLNELKRQESALVVQKQDLENDIARWNDKAYVTAQARDRLGFVFPGEQSIRVEHPEAVTGQKADPRKQAMSQKAGEKKLPWYGELSYSLKKADTPVQKVERP